MINLSSVSRIFFSLSFSLFFFVVNVSESIGEKECFVFFLRFYFRFLIATCYDLSL